MSAAIELGPIFHTLLGEDPAVRIQFWDGSSIGSNDAKAIVDIKSPEALRHVIWAPGELGVSRAYITGSIDIGGDVYEGVRALLGGTVNIGDVGAKTVVRTAKYAYRLGLFSQSPEIPTEEIVPAGRRHSIHRDAQAVSHHYDVGNDFYALILGDTMTYSCARFIDGSEDLDTAQRQKYDLICRKLGLKPGMQMLDVGCGWGGLAMHAAEHYGAHVVGITISNEQATFARACVADAGLNDKVVIRVQDYRDLADESFDAISSVGMFEHVGLAQMTNYFAKLYSVLNDKGRLLNHAISKPHGSVMAANGFIARYVFPDGELQDVAASLQAMEDVGLEVRDVESLREHYDKTLRFWVANLESNWDAAVAMVGEVRARIWHIYMIGSAVEFATNRISIHQTLGVKTPASGDADMDLTRRAFV